MEATASRKQQRQNLTEGPVFRKLLLFALPLLGTNLIQQLYNTVDIFFAGNFITDGNAMAAVGASSMIVTMLVGFFNGLAVGCGVVIALAYGSHNQSRIEKAVHSAVAVALLGGIGLSVLGFFLSPHILVWMQTPEDILEMASTYIQVYFLSVLALVVYNVCTGILRAVGDSRSPLIYQCIGGVCNVIADAICVGWFQLGVMGIAVATLFSQTIPAICVVVHLCVTKKPYRLVWRKLRIHKSVFLQILRVGVPSGLQSCIMTFSNLIVQSQINGLGTDAIGSFTAYFRVELIMYLPICAFGQAITTFVGQNVGAEQYHRASRGIRCCLLMSMGLSVFTCAFCILFTPMLFGLFGASEAEIAIGCQIMPIFGGCYIIYNFLEILSGVLRGSGNALAPMIIYIVNLCGVRISVLLLFVNLFHSVQSVAFCYPISWVTTSVCLIVAYFLSKVHKQSKAHKATHRMGEAVR